MEAVMFLPMVLVHRDPSTTNLIVGENSCRLVEVLALAHPGDDT